MDGPLPRGLELNRFLGRLKLSVLDFTLEIFSPAISAPFQTLSSCRLQAVPACLPNLPRPALLLEKAPKFGMDIEFPKDPLHKPQHLWSQKDIRECGKLARGAERRRPNVMETRLAKDVKMII